ncbi:uncharacterized protein LOC135833267 isoform X1 [Planococcus citri]|uniref:uncharacterized protein LOC135833267 isoform X1 n=1 Tax=Planococcus citri TaxID=170843 RepID=UPI0031F8440D
MNSVLALLLSASLVITVSIILVEGKSTGKMWDQRYIKECKDELNLTNHRFTVADVKSIIPTTLEEGCILDCFNFKIGKIQKIKITNRTELKFVGQPPKSGTDLTKKSAIYVKKVVETEVNCANFLSTFRVKECYLVSQHRCCVYKVLNWNKPKNLTCNTSDDAFY